jgi:hypothetical protein
MTITTIAAGIMTMTEVTTVATTTAATIIDRLASPVTALANPGRTIHFRQHVLEHLLVVTQVRHHPLQSRILFLELAKTLRLRYFYAAVLRLPAISRLFGHAVAPHQLHHRHARLVLLRNRDDLLF